MLVGYLILCYICYNLHCRVRSLEDQIEVDELMNIKETK
jgi:hypothetical protein